MGSKYYKLEKKLGYKFNQIDLLEQALTHRSFSRENNEKFEFIGDSVLNLVIAYELFQNKPELTEGELSKIRSSLVNQDSLSEIAVDLELGLYMNLGDGELKSGGASRPSILADAVEAIFAAIMLDGSFDKARVVVRNLYEFKIKRIDTHFNDYKSTLQELLHARGIVEPSYEIIGTEGPDHELVFNVLCSIPDLKLSYSAKGKGKKIASQLAAKQLLLILNKG